MHVQGSEDIAEGTCAVHEECSNLVGDCCPSLGGFDLFCCNTTEGSCAVNPGCVQANVTGECCPTVDNVFLDCCDRDFAKCAAHPYCAHLADDCCPTKSGVFLDCCLQDESLSNITFPFNEDAASCAMNEHCAGLDGACCPTVDGVFLYCCGQSERTSNYQVVKTLVSPSIPESEQLGYLISSSPYVIGPATTGAPGTQAILYERNSTLDFDLIYYEAADTSEIGNAGDFVVGTKKFYLNIWTDAPPCTQVLLQLDKLPTAEPGNFPTGRHSRYISFTTKEQTWERIEFDFLDLLDETVGNDEINALALFLDPGNTDTYTYYFDFLDITVNGCSGGNNCEVPSIKKCPTFFGGEEAGLPDETDSPTNAPNTQMPTELPTTSPTSSPISSPTGQPTDFPTAEPTLAPTDSPSDQPSLTPTGTPSSGPTASPTSGPTTSPTALPTAGPTVSPTQSPTSSPVVTSSPTSSTSAPTSVPTDSPTAAPTGSPTFQPTLAPTGSPTGTPTGSPTSAPTTGTPTTAPTDAPTVEPSSSPTASPSVEPTGSPTAVPTPSPTRSPTETPTEPFAGLPPTQVRDRPSCADGKDNDGDGYYDCADPDCCYTLQCWHLWRRTYQTAISQRTVAVDAPAEPTTTDSAAAPVLLISTSTIVALFCLVFYI